MNRRSAPLLSLVIAAAVGSAIWRGTNGPAAAVPETRHSAQRVAADDTPEPAPDSAFAARSHSRAAARENADVRGAALEKILAFEQWMEGSHGQHIGPTAIATGTELARDRRAALKQLITIDPREALQHAIPQAARTAFPAGIASQFETPVDAFADFELISICDGRVGRYDRWTMIGSRTYATYTYGRRLATITAARLPVHGIAVDDVLAMSDAPYRPLDETADVAKVRWTNDVSTTGRITVNIGDTTRTFASSAELDQWADSALRLEGTPGASGVPGSIHPLVAAPDWIAGEKTVLWIRAEFPDDLGSPATEAQITAAMNVANTLYQDVSQGVTSFTTTIVPAVLRMTTTKAAAEAGTSYVTLRAEALQLAREYDTANGATGLYDPDRYDRYVVVFKEVAAYDWAGIAVTGGKGIAMNGTTSAGVTAHEFGHNHGLRHSHGWVPVDGNPIGSGVHFEYGDAFDVMGSAQSATSGGHFNVIQKVNLGYMGAGSVQTVTSTGVYRIHRHDDRNASGTRALKIASAWADINYWLEYRHTEPYSGFRAPYAGTAQLSRLQSGVVLHLDNGPKFGGGPGTYLLDMTAGATSGMPAPSYYGSSISHMLDDAALALGEVFIDPGLQMRVLPVAVGGSAPNEWIDVYVSFNPPATNQSPTLAASAPAGPITARSEITFQATASDPDGDTVYFHWDFGDGSIAPASASVTHRWLKGGTYTVRCMALDGRGGWAGTEFQVTVEDPLLSWQRRSEGMTTASFFDVLFDGAKFVAVGTSMAATSTDGVNWSLAQGMGSVYNYAVAHGNSRYVAVGSPAGSGDMTAGIYSSPDGVNWAPQTPPAGIQALLDVEFGAGRFVAVGYNGAVLSSADGVTWTVADTGTTKDLMVVRYGGNRFVIAGEEGTYLTSTDGVNWENVSIPGESSSAWALIHHRGQWISMTGSYATTDSTKRIAWVSSDARNWTKMYLDVDYSVQALASAGDSSLLLALSRADDRRIFLAENLYDWAAASVVAGGSGNAGAYLESVVEGNGTIVLVGRQGQIYTPTGRPLIGTAPTPQTVTAGQTIALSVGAFATGPFTYQWKRDGIAIAGATTPSLVLTNATTADAGDYTVVVTNSTGSVTTTAARVVVNSPEPSTGTGRLTNLSIRSTAGTGDQSLIVGVSIGAGLDGTRKPLLIRAVGPTLAGDPFNLPGTVPDPVLTVRKLQTSDLVAENQGWADNAQIVTVGASLGAFPLRAGSVDAALYLELSPESYTMQVSGRTAPGMALVEMYDATAGSFSTGAPRLTNISARTQIGTGGDVLIAGFNVGGTTRMRLLIRGIGPTLAGYGVSGTLADPKLELYRQGESTVLLENDNWEDTAQISAARESVGAFGLTRGTKDAVLLVELEPGTYSAVVKGVGDTTGVALVELYAVP